MLLRRRMIGKSGGILPAGYKQLQYINTNYSGSYSAYLDTGISASDISNYPIVIAKFKMNTLGDKLWFGSSSASGGYILYNYQSANNVLWARFGDRSYSGWVYQTGHTATELNFKEQAGTVRLELSNGHPAAYNDDTGVLVATKPLVTPDFSSTETILIGYNTQYAADADWHYFALKDGDVLKFEGIPCENDQGVVGMYDLVSRQFLSSLSTRPFIAGPYV